MTEHLDIHHDPAADVFADVTRVVTDIAGGPDLLEVELAGETRFFDDLALESIDLVTLATTLSDESDGRINLAGRLAELTLDDVVALTIGRIVELAVADLAPADAR